MPTDNVTAAQALDMLNAVKDKIDAMPACGEKPDIQDKLQMALDEVAALDPESKIAQCKSAVKSVSDALHQCHDSHTAMTALYVNGAGNVTTVSAAGLASIPTAQIALAKGGLELARFLMDDHPDPKTVAVENKVLNGAAEGCTFGGAAGAAIGFACGGPIGALMGASVGTFLAGGVGAATGPWIFG